MATAKMTLIEKLTSISAACILAALVVVSLSVHNANAGSANELLQILPALASTPAEAAPLAP